MRPVDIWPWARHRMTTEQRAEIHRWAREHGPVQVGYSASRGEFFATTARGNATHPSDPFAAFTAATTEIVSVLG